MYWNKAQTFDVDAIKFSFRTIVFTQYMQDVFILHFSKLTLRVCTLVLFILHMHNYIYIYIYIYIIESVDSIYIKNIFLNEQKLGMLLQKRTDTRGVGISSMRKSIYLLQTTPSSHTHRFHPLPLATPTSCSPHRLATPIHSTHSPQLSSIL